MKHYSDLKVSESVKIKGKNYIRDYMKRVGSVYEPKDDGEDDAQVDGCADEEESGGSTHRTDSIEMEIHENE